VLGGVLVVLAASVGVLIASLVMHGPSGAVVAVADVAMLVATLAWFFIKVARRPPPPDEGSAERGERR
jgi:hypothetical protein